MKILITGKIECEWDGNISQWRSCGKWIGWAKTVAGKRMPFDRDEKYTAHWASCKNAGDFNGKK